jgi:hypothetical protein
LAALAALMGREDPLAQVGRVGAWHRLSPGKGNRDQRPALANAPPTSMQPALGPA